MDYTKSTNFAAKDALASGNAAKVVKGTEIDTEFNNIATAIATKTDDSSAAITGGTIDGTAIGGTTPAAGAFTTLSASGVSSFADGSASAPAITNTGDTNTGIFFPAADTIAFAEGGTEAMRLDSSGNMGLGVTPSASWQSVRRVFQVGGNGALWGQASGAGTLFFSNNTYYDGTNFRYLNTSGAGYYAQLTDGSHAWNIASSGTAGNAITFTQAMTLDASGNLGVGTTSPAKKLDVSTGDIRLSSGYTVQWGGTANYIYGDSTSNFFVVATNGAERVRIDSSGNLLVGATSFSNSGGGVALASGASGENLKSSATSTGAWGHYGLYNGNGRVGLISTNGTGTTYATSSDYRLKENIAPMTGALDAVAQLKPCTYTWKADGAAGQGFIAHELQSVVPDAVVGEKDAVDDDGNPQYQGIDTSFLVATLTAAIQEQQAIIETLTNRITALEAK